MIDKNKAFTAARWSTVSAITRSTIQFIQVVVLTHLLPPSVYGRVAILYVLVGFATVFSDLGLNAAFVSAQNVTYRQRSSMFWLNIIFATISTLFLIFSSSRLSKYYGDVELESLINALSITLLVAALGQQVKMSAEKMLKFKPVAIIEIVASFVGLITCTFFAIMGYEAHSMVIGLIMSCFISTFLIWIFLSDGFVPLFYISLREVKPFLRFGFSSIGSALLGNISRSFDILLGGRYLTSSQLGFYSVPRNLSLQIQFVINPIISRVGFPLIAKSRHDLNLVRRIYLKTMNMTSSINAPLYTMMFFFSDEIVTVVFGLDWRESAHLLKILAVWGGLRSTLNPIGSLAEGMGRADLEFKWTILCVLIFPIAILIGSFAAAAEGVAYAQLIVIGLLVIPNWYFLVKPLCGAKFFEYMAITFKPFLLSILSILFAFLILASVEQPIYKLFFGCMLGAIFYILTSLKFNSDWFWAMVELIYPKKKIHIVAGSK